MFNFQYSQAELDAQVAALSMPMQLWLNWMMLVVIIMPIFFFRRPQGRIAILCSILLIATAIPTTRIVGMSNFLSLLHLIIWTPLLIYFSHQLRHQRIPIKSVFGIWSLTMITTLIISLVFDIRDFGRWLMGERGVVSVTQFEVAWLCLFFILLCILLIGGYIFKKPPTD